MKYERPVIWEIQCQSDSTCLAYSGEVADTITPIKAEVDDITSETTWESSFTIDLN